MDERILNGSPVFLSSFWRQGGQYLINIIDVYGSAYPLSIVSLLEAVSIMWTYGQFSHKSAGHSDCKKY